MGQNKKVQQTNKQRNKQASKQTNNKQVNKQTNKHQASKQANKQTYKHKQTNKQQASKQTNKQTLHLLYPILLYEVHTVSILIVSIPGHKQVSGQILRDLLGDALVTQHGVLQGLASVDRAVLVPAEFHEELVESEGNTHVFQLPLAQVRQLH